MNWTMVNDSLPEISEYSGQSRHVVIHVVTDDLEFDVVACREYDSNQLDLSESWAWIWSAQDLVKNYNTVYFQSDVVAWCDIPPFIAASTEVKKKNV